MRNAFLAGALAAGALLASPASARTDCLGEQSIVYVCVTTPEVGVGSHTLCVFAGGTECRPVEVPVPTTEGEVDYDLNCGNLDVCATEPAFLRAVCAMIGPNVC